MDWYTDGKPDQTGYYALKCTPYDDQENEWVCIVFVRNNKDGTVVIFDPRGLIEYPNLEIPMDDLKIASWYGPIEIPQ